MNQSSSNCGDAAGVNVERLGECHGDLDTRAGASVEPNGFLGKSVEMIGNEGNGCRIRSHVKFLMSSELLV